MIFDTKTWSDFDVVLRECFVMLSVLYMMCYSLKSWSVLMKICVFECKKCVLECKMMKFDHFSCVFDGFGCVFKSVCYVIVNVHDV